MTIYALSQLVLNTSHAAQSPQRIPAKTAVSSIAGSMSVTSRVRSTQRCTALRVACAPVCAQEENA